MKKLILLVLTMHLIMQINAQLTVDAGNDIIVCCCTEDDKMEIIQLGGCPAATGGIPPYTYSWSGKHYDLKFPGGIPSWIYASDILDDTTKSNPIIQNMRNVKDEWTTYHLKVEDAVGNVQWDSVKIKLSTIINLLYLVPPDTIYKGDSVQFFGNPYLSSNFLPFVEFSFNPSHGLTDPTDVYTWAKPDTTTTYYFQATNSVGCVSSWHEYWQIVVIDTTTVSSTLITQPESSCYFSGENLIIERKRTNTPYRLVITNLLGQIIHKDIHYQSSLVLSDLKLKPNGLYIITLDDGKQKESFKLINYQ